MIEKRGGVSPGTLRFYQQKIKLFIDYCDSRLVENIQQITPSFIREFLLYLEETNHYPGGHHAAFRTLRAFLYWLEDEAEPEGRKNPIRKVRAPRVPEEPIEPVSFEEINKLIKACSFGTFVGDRDIAIFLCLLGTGARASEFLNIDLKDVNQAPGEIIIRQGVFVNRKTYHFNIKKATTWIPKRKNLTSKNLPY